MQLGSAAHRVDVVGSVGEAFGFSFKLSGADLPLASYTWTYEVYSECGSALLASLTQSTGIVVNTTTGAVSISSASINLSCGTYLHRARVTGTGRTSDFFDGRIDITE